MLRTAFLSSRVLLQGSNDHAKTRVNKLSDGLGDLLVRRGGLLNSIEHYMETMIKPG